MSARTLNVVSAWIALSVAAACAETGDRSKMLTHPLNVVGPAHHSPAGSAIAEPVLVRLTQEGGSQSATVAAGQKLVIVIAGNPSTGYQWELTDSVNGAVLTQEGRAEFVAGAPDLVGAPGEYRFTFKAIAQGVTGIGMKYVRPWEQNKAPAAKATVSVTVTEQDQDSIKPQP